MMRPDGNSCGNRSGNGFAPNGFTLVELLVALGLFSLIAGAATLLTFTAVRTAAATDGRLADTQALARLRVLLAADLGQAAMRSSVAENGALVPAFVLTPAGFVAVRRGVSGVLPTVQKIAWGYDGTRLLRQGWPAIDGSRPGPAMVLLAGVTAVRWRVFGADGWQQTWQPAAPDALPRGVELMVQRGRLPAVTLRFLVAA
jgi:general secretion pathway protein J